MAPASCLEKAGDNAKKGLTFAEYANIFLPKSLKEDVTMSQWITVATYLDRNSAHIAKGKLESAGIPAQVQADDMGGNRPYLGFGTGVRLMV